MLSPAAQSLALAPRFNAKDNGKEHGSNYIYMYIRIYIYIVYWGYIETMEKWKLLKSEVP